MLCFWFIFIRCYHILLLIKASQSLSLFWWCHLNSFHGLIIIFIYLTLIMLFNFLIQSWIIGFVLYRTNLTIIIFIVFLVDIRYWFISLTLEIFYCNLVIISIKLWLLISFWRLICCILNIILCLTIHLTNTSN